MNRFLLILVSCLCLTTVVSAQSNKLIKELESKRGALQQQIAETESLLKNTKKDVGSQLNGLAALTGQIEERKLSVEKSPDGSVSSEGFSVT